jgi:hypothetical protein
MGWYEAIKDVVTVADRLRDAELKQRLAAVQVECAKLAEDNAAMRQELTELRQQVRTRQEMKWRENVYWRELNGGNTEGPFCPKCLDGVGKVARMADRSDDTCWRCAVCFSAVRKTGAKR